MAALPRRYVWTPNTVCAKASSRCWWPRRRSSSASISDTSISSARSRHRTGSQPFYSESGARAIKGVPKGRIFPLTRDDLIECAAMVHAVRDGELDVICVPDQPLDVLAQQVVAEAAAEQEWDEDALFR